MKSPREHLHTHLANRLYFVLSHPISGLSEKRLQEDARLFARTMMYFVELYTTDWKDPTLEELQEAIRQMKADWLLLDALGEAVILED